MTAGDWIVLAALGILVLAISVGLWKNRKTGCCGNCAGCAQCCHKDRKSD